eukprot:g45813.t1
MQQNPRLANFNKFIQDTKAAQYVIKGQPNPNQNPRQLVMVTFEGKPKNAKEAQVVQEFLAFFPAVRIIRAAVGRERRCWLRRRAGPGVFPGHSKQLGPD